MKFPSPVKWVHIQAASGDSADEDDFSEDSGYEAPETACKKMLRGVRGIIFDFDGTLFDNAFIAIRLISAYPLDILRIRRERLVRRRFAGSDYSTPEKYNGAFFSELGRPFLRTPVGMRNWYFDRYMPRMVRVLKKYYKPRPGLVDLLRRIDNPASSTRMAIYSDYPFLKERMEALGLFTTERIRLYGPDSFGAQKPAVRPFLEIAKNMNLPPEEILVVGDREDTDGLGAFRAGMHFFCLETGNKRYFRLDPYRRKPEVEPHGPNLLMYAGAWDRLIKMLMDRN
jgi:HAD superfamily hydrolase (TIGR01549 family)